MSLAAMLLQTHTLYDDANLLSCRYSLPTVMACKQDLMPNKDLIASDGDDVPTRALLSLCRHTRRAYQPTAATATAYEWARWHQQGKMLESCDNQRVLI